MRRKMLSDGIKKIQFDNHSGNTKVHESDYIVRSMQLVLRIVKFIMSSHNKPFPASQTIKSVAEILIYELAAAVDRLKACVLPIYICGPENKIFLNGSGVLVEIDNRHFLCTAVHVIDINKDSTLLLDSGGKFVKFSDTFHISRQFDVAVCALTPEHREQLSTYSSLKIENIAVPIDKKTWEFVEFVGYPETKNRFLPHIKKMDKAIYSFGTTIQSIDIQNVIVKFNRKKKLDINSEYQVTSPDLHGLSGGAMFGFQTNDSLIRGNPTPKLIGITTESNSEWTKIKGTNIGVVISIIKKKWEIELPNHVSIEHYAPVIPPLTESQQQLSQLSSNQSRGEGSDEDGNENISA